MGLFSKPKIGGNELQRCLAYYEAKLKVTAFQTKEADLFNDALVKYRTSKTSPLADGEVCNAANRLVQAAHEVKRRYEGTKPVPNAAHQVHHAWHITVQYNTAWAEAMLQAMEALANGWTPLYAEVQLLDGKHQLAQHEAEREDKKFLKRLGTRADAIAEIISRSNDAAATDNWQPSLKGLWQNAKAGVP